VAVSDPAGVPSSPPSANDDATLHVVVNAGANGGRARRRWERVERALRDRGVAFTAVAPRSETDAAAEVRRAVSDGARVIVAAGGDGTVNTVLNALMDETSDRPRGDVTLGAIGLGSSNDAHKPFTSAATLGRSPLRIAHRQARLIDVGRAEIATAGAAPAVRYFLLNASVGVVAEGNAYFNRGGPLTDRLKRLNVEAAIIWSAVRTIARFDHLPIALTLDGGGAEQLEITTAGILKSVHFAGGMRYDTPVERDDGTFAVNVLRRAGTAEILATIPRLYAGRFASHRKAMCRRAQTVELSSAQPFHLELDGEVYETARARLSVVPRVLRWCGVDG
jgi:diacylglycerol kinase (ATP)